MNIKRLKNKLLLGAVAINIIVALSSMLVISLVIRQQYLDQSNSLLRKASDVIEDNLAKRKSDLLAASRQLAAQKNLGPTIWYLAQYAQSDIDRETLFNTYQKLVRDTFQVGRIANLSKIEIYDNAGHLVTFALFDSHSVQVGFVEHFPSLKFQVATLEDGKELNRNDLHALNSVARIDQEFGGKLPQQESAHYAVVDGLLAIESHMPIMGETFDQATGKAEVRQLGLVALVQPLNQSFADLISRLTDTKINVFTSQGFSSGDMAGYRNPDWRGLPAGGNTQPRTISFNEIEIEGGDFYQSLIPLYTDQHLVGTISALHSKEITQKNIREMAQILGLIAFASMLLIFIFAWIFASSISRPLTILSRIFRNVASGKQAEMSGVEFRQLEQEKNRDDELGDLTKSFIAMDDAIKQKIKQINEINASLEEKIGQRTGELRIAATAFESQESIMITDVDGVILRVNPSFTRTTGYTTEEAVGQTPRILKSGYHDTAFYQQMWETIHRTGSWQGEIWDRRKNGEIYPKWLTISAVKGDDGTVSHYVGTHIDITERKAAENALLESKRLLIAEIEHRTKIEKAIRHVAATVSFDTGNVFFDHLVEELAKLFGADFSFVGVLDDQQPETIATLSLYAHGKHVNNMSYSLMHTPCANVVGRQTCVYPEKVAQLFPEDKLLQDMGVESYIGAPMFDAAGKQMGLIVVLDGKPMTDTLMVVEILEIFSARASAELQRLHDEQQLRIAAATFESHEGLLITNADNVILRANRAFSSITGYPAEEVIGKSPHIFSSGRHGTDFYAAMWNSLGSTGSWDGEIWNRRKDGEIYPAHLSITAVKSQEGIITNYVATHTDISQRKEAEEQINNLAFYDPLTRLPNRRLLVDRLKHALASSSRSDLLGALLFIDLDNFKTLNDTLGHDMGDILLQQVAQRLEYCLREGDTVARLGGDEFVVILENLGGQIVEAATLTEAVSEKMLALFEQPYLLSGQKYHITASIGATLFGNNPQTTDHLLKQADIAMYQAKKAGRNILCFFDQKMQESINNRVALESELHKAIENQEFHLYYQIQVDSLRRPLGAEALIRWIHPEHGMVSPAQFIPLAEETGLIVAIGQWVLETACIQIKTWQQDVLTRDLAVAVNVSAKQFRHADFVAQVQAAVQRHAINPKLLKLELTESLLLESIEDTITTMNALSAIGVVLSLDDFGTGYSSLQYLKRLPLDQLKIDQSFVRDIATDSSDEAIVRTIIAMAQSLGLNVIAEGVETEVQRQFLLNNGCTDYQGYLFGKPVPIAQFDASLQLN